MTTMDERNAFDDGNPEKNVSRKLAPGLFMSILIIGVLVTAGIKLTDPVTLPVRHVSVSGDFVHLSPVSLQKRVSDVVRGGFFNVNVETIQDVLLEEPWIMEVAVKRIWPDRLTVNIREQNAIAKWGENGLISMDAHIFFPEFSTFPENLPVIYGPNNSEGLVMERLLNVQRVLPEDLQVKELTLTQRRSWKLILENGLVMRLGKDNIVARVQQFFDYLPVKAMNRLEQIDYIDMRYTNGFVIRWHAETKSPFNHGQGDNG